MFRRVIQSAIDKGRLKFSKAQQMDQLDSIGLDDKQVSNWLALVADSPKVLMMAENQVMEPTDQESHLEEPIATDATESAQPPLGMAKPTPAHPVRLSYSAESAAIQQCFLSQQTSEQYFQPQ
jgi:hypothetical protein